MATLSFKVTVKEAALIRRRAKQERHSVSEFLRARATGEGATRQPAAGYRIVRSRVTKLPVMVGPAGCPGVKSEDVRALLADFP